MGGKDKEHLEGWKRTGRGRDKEQCEKGTRNSGKEGKGTARERETDYWERKTRNRVREGKGTVGGMAKN
jgi:hypothetical protein